MIGAAILNWMRQWALRIAIMLIIVVSAWLSGYFYRGTKCADEQAKNQIKQLTVANATLASNLASATSAANQLLSNLNDLQTRTDAINARLKNAPYTVPTKSCTTPGDAHLSVAGRMLWNSTLDYSVPSGPSGADATAVAASAALSSDSGVSLAQARDNAQVNFQRFSQCYLQLTALQKLLHVEQMNTH